MARSTLFSPTAELRRNAISKGLMRGNRAWLAIGAVVWGARLLRKSTGKSAETLAVMSLKPGEGLRIRTMEPHSEAERKAFQRGAR
jgi:hypothetical protein